MAEDGSSPADPPLRSKIEDEIAEEFARSTGSDPSRIRAIVGRIGNHLTGLILRSDESYRDDLRFSLRHCPGLETALGILPQEKALTLFETEDLKRLTRRVLAAQYLSDPTTPFYTRGELGEVIRELIRHLTANRDALIAGGLPRAPFSRSTWLQSQLGGLYFVAHPPELQRVIDDDGVASLGWARAAGGPPADDDWLNLEPIQSSRLLRLREPMFEIKLRILRELVDAVETRSGTHIRQTCLGFLKEALKAEDVSFLLKMDGLISTRHEPWADAGRAQVMHDASFQTGSGGVSALLQTIAHIEQELIIGQADRTKLAMGPLAQHLDTPSTRTGEQYYNLVGGPDSETMTSALDCFLDLESKVHALAQDFYEHVQREVPADFESETFVTVRGKRKHISQLAAFHRGLRPWLESQFRSEDGLPSLPALLAAIEDLVVSNEFRLEGEYWTIRFEGTTIHLNDSKGLRHIAQLLARPGEQIPAEELQVLASPEPPVRPEGPGQQPGDRANGMSVVGSLDGGEELLDQMARDEYRDRLKQLRADREDATQSNDDARLRAIDLETQEIEKELSAGRSLGGRPRRQPGSHDKARQAVSSSIRRGLIKIGKAHNPLWLHLNESLTLGTSCCYKPHDPMDWQL